MTTCASRIVECATKASCRLYRTVLIMQMNLLDEWAKLTLTHRQIEIYRGIISRRTQREKKRYRLVSADSRFLSKIYYIVNKLLHRALCECNFYMCNHVIVHVKFCVLFLIYIIPILDINYRFYHNYKHF